MKYFCKWLPVDGEAIIGDYVMDSEWNKEFGLGMVTRIDRKISMFDVKFPCFEVSVASNIESTKKVKLFLCSRAIEIGEEYHTPNSNVTLISKWDSWDQDGVKQDIESHHLHVGSYKVIGGISVDAYSYIKEEQEFTSDDVEFYCFQDSGQPHNLPHIINEAGVKTINEEEYNKQLRRVVVKIKCPCCNKFN